MKWTFHVLSSLKVLRIYDDSLQVQIAQTSYTITLELRSINELWLC